MTWPQHWTLDQKREAQRLKMIKYRAEKRDYLRLYEQKRYLSRHVKRRELIFRDRTCRLCGIALATPIHGAYRTVVHCSTCSKDVRTINRLKMREWRTKNARRIPTFA